MQVGPNVWLGRGYLGTSSSINTTNIQTSTVVQPLMDAAAAAWTSLGQNRSIPTLPPATEDNAYPGVRSGFT